MELKITFNNAEEFAEKIVDLFIFASENNQEKLNAMLANRVTAEQTMTAYAQPAAPAPAQQLAQQAPPIVAAPTQATAQTYAQPTAPPASVVPLASAPQYTQEQLGVAGVGLMDSGRQQELFALLDKFQVQAITQLQPDQYGAFAADLRALGAAI